MLMLCCRRHKNNTHKKRINGKNICTSAFFVLPLHGNMRQWQVRHIILAVVIGTLAVAPASVYAQYVGGGTSVFSFMSLPVSSRLNALGGSNVSIRDGELSMAMCNPALLGERTDKVLSLNFAYWMEGTMFGSVLYGHNFGRSKIEYHPDEPDKPNYFAVGVHYLDHGKMKYADEFGNLTGGTFTAKDILIDAIYARQLGPMFSVGVSIKPVYSIYETRTSFALGADVGGHFQLPDSTLQIGLTLQNIGWQLKGYYSREDGTKREMLPLNLQLGISYRFKHAPLRLSMTIHNMQQWKLGYENTNIHRNSDGELEENANVAWYDMMFRHTIFALDIVPKSERFYLTLSYNHRRRAEMNLKDQRSLAGFAIGGGVRIYKFRIGFAFSQHTKSNFTYQVGLSLDINSLLK